jgi:chemotaxis protein MotB
MAAAQEPAEKPQEQAAPAAAPAPAPAPAPDDGGSDKRPIIVKKIIDEGHGGHHGGAWKIALADMMTAMMAFFLLMWLLGATTEDRRKSVADYFRPASHSQIKFGEMAGSDGLLGGSSVVDVDGFPFTARQSSLLERLTPKAQGGANATEGGAADQRSRDGTSDSEPKPQASAADQENFDKLEAQLREDLSKNPQLQAVKDTVSIVRESDGLRIEIIDKADFSMFRLGTADLDPRAAALLGEVARSLQALPNRLAVRGHTDSLGFADASGRSNWSLSTERADATRQLMVGAGVNAQRFSRIEGVADTQPFVPRNPADPRNRRVSITVLNQ